MTNTQPPNTDHHDVEEPWRHLSQDEKSQLLTRVKERWDIEGYWYPLKAEKQPGDVISVWLGHDESSPVMRIIPDDDCPEMIQMKERIISLFKDKGYDRIICFENKGREDDMAIEFAVDDFEFSFGVEEFWCPAGAEWLIYTSHESTIAFGGDWLVAEVAPLLSRLGLVK